MTSREARKLIGVITHKVIKAAIGGDTPRVSTNSRNSNKLNAKYVQLYTA